VKNTRFEFRLSERNLELIKRVANQFGMDVSALILSVLIPYCCKVDNSNKKD